MHAYDEWLAREPVPADFHILLGEWTVEDFEKKEHLLVVDDFCQQKGCETPIGLDTDGGSTDYWAVWDEYEDDPMFFCECCYDDMQPPQE